MAETIWGAVISSVTTAALFLMGWLRWGRKDKAEVDHIEAETTKTMVESSEGIISNFERLLEETRSHFEKRIEAVDAQNADILDRLEYQRLQILALESDKAQLQEEVRRYDVTVTTLVQALKDADIEVPHILNPPGGM